MRARSSPISEADSNEASLAPADAWAWTIWPSKASCCCGSVVRRAKSTAGANSPASRNARSCSCCSWGGEAVGRGGRHNAHKQSHGCPAQPAIARTPRDHDYLSFHCWNDSEIIARAGSATAIPLFGLRPSPETALQPAASHYLKAVRNRKRKSGVDGFFWLRRAGDILESLRKICRQIKMRRSRNAYRLRSRYRKPATTTHPQWHTARGRIIFVDCAVLPKFPTVLTPKPR